MTESTTQHRLANDPQMPKAGQLVGGRYEIRGVLGEGGFAVVYSAFDSRTKALVAVKILDPIMSRRSEFSSRFMREVETVSRLRHHNTISIFDAGETESGCLYLVMELLEGRPLDAVIDSERALSADRVKTIASQVLKSLQEAHSKNIIHRDLKPANVFLADLAGEADYVKVLDFGIAKSIDDSQDASLTATGQVMCSPHYVAPERIKDHLTVPASDLYSLGVMMIELLDGKPPYEAESPMMLAVKHLTPEPVPLGATAQAAPYADVIRKACAKSLEDRYETAADMLADLVSATGSLAVDPTTATIRLAASQTMGVGVGDDTEDFDTHSHNRRIGSTLAIGLVITLLIAGAGFAIFGTTGPPDPEPAEPAVAAVSPPPTAVDPLPEPEPLAPEADLVRGDVAGVVSTASRLSVAARTAANAYATLRARELEAAARAEELEAQQARSTSSSRSSSRSSTRPPAAQPDEAAADEAAARMRAELEARARQRELDARRPSTVEAPTAAPLPPAATAPAATTEEEEAEPIRRIRDVRPRQ